MSIKGFAIVTGMPAAGKTAIGRLIANSFGWPFLDKDDILEAEFNKFSAVDLPLRQRLSRESDEVFADQAKALPSGVLVSFWRPRDLSVSYGTATDWIAELHAAVVELHCKCEPDVARERFLKRQRHQGHNDELRVESLTQQFDELAALGPLNLGPCVTIDTTHSDDIAALAHEAIREMRELLSSSFEPGVSKWDTLNP